VDTDIYSETPIIYRLKQIIIKYSKMITGKSHLWSELPAILTTFLQKCILKTSQQLPQKQVFFRYFCPFREKKQAGDSLQNKENEFA